MKFRLDGNGEMEMVRARITGDMKQSFSTSTAFIVDTPRIKESIKNMEFLKGKTMVMTLPFAIGAINVASQGIFWGAFLEYIFPWMLDIAKVFCLIKIAQSFYEEKRGGRDGASGFGSLVTWGKWYLAFWLLPLGVELIDQIGNTMFNDLQGKTIETMR